MKLISECDVDQMLEARCYAEDDFRHYVVERYVGHDDWAVVGWLPTSNTELALEEFRKILPKIADEGKKHELWKGWLDTHPSQDEQVA